MLNKNNFESLKRNCDSILIKNLSIFTISNNVLNLIKGHPFHLKPYNQNPGKIFYNFFFYLFKNILDLIASFTIHFSSKIEIPTKTVDVLLISNLVNIERPITNDYIFSDLEKNLKKKKVSYHKILVNHTSNERDLKKKKYNKKNISILEFKFTNYKNIFYILFKQIKFFSFFLIKGLLETNKKKKKLLYISAIEFLSLNTKRNINLYKNFENILSKISFKKIILPYEGYSWERLILHSSKKKNKKIKCFGYHFSSISKFQHSILRKIGTFYEPDIIFTTGTFSQKILKKNLKIPIKILGTNRFFKKKKKINDQNVKNLKCLVLPEGIISECKKLFEFSIELAKMFPKVSFIWRLHPTMHFYDILRIINKRFNYLPRNIILSKKNFFKDIQSAHICLYRGSTSAVTALQKGIIPVYYKDNDLNIDPLFGLNKWKKTIMNTNDFKKIIDLKKNSLSSDTYNKKFAINFSLNYFKNFNANELIKELKDIN